MTSIWAVVPAAGSGRRMTTEIPKQYLTVSGASLLEHTMRALLASSQIRGVVAVIDPSDRRADQIASLSDPRVFTAAGGAERVDSVLSGLQYLNGVADDDDWVLVHDAARPCLPIAVLTRLIDHVVDTAQGAILAQPITDTIKRCSEAGMVIETLDRNALWRAQTPQMFRLHELRSALSAAIAANEAVTDEAAAMSLAGYAVQIVEGPACNFKVTVSEDLKRAELYLKALEAGQ
ncbi:2-C-methyl-D-erythritol 4-phosphate cytidylyltransferase [Paraglaciecola sp.]|nr:2-C-methyl-D-erythritol 4-phosphate cytidylyltransferase [Paraglaciecola sp.]MDB4281926.1 2-C-methyl-D-erythritol 4-phosphate cytidylyltransferase [Paraglaciecola sp.]